MSSRDMARATLLCLALGLLALTCCAGEARGNSNNGQEKAVPAFACDACLEFSTEAQIILSDPDTRRQAADLISQLACQSLTPKLKIKCVDLVNAYVTDALTTLQLYLGPELCTEAGLCVPEATRDISLPRNLPNQAHRANANTCVFCKDFAEHALSYLEANATKLKIISSLHLACARLEDMSKQCDFLVDVYAPDLINHLGAMTPEEFCEIVHLCKPTRKRALANRAVNRNDCAICQFVVLEVKLKLRDPVTQERLLEVLLSGCNRVQNHVDECKMIVEQYAPFILANLDTILNADVLCAKIGACQAQKTNTDYSVLVLPSEGQSRHRLL